MSNLLQHETSPYLLQHAHNPVNWMPWGTAALALAKEKDLPILLSIGYSSCHWCHVMERESFENERTADIMNTNYVCIKVDREERPDLDHIYMEAVQILTGSGGWPLNVFLTPDLKPFYGGTYFPPIPAHNRPSWPDVLIHLAGAYKNQKEEVVAQSDKLMDYLTKNNATKFSAANSSESSVVYALLNKDNIQKIVAQITTRLDKVNGGFESAPKFLGTFTLRWMLWYSQQFESKEALQHVTVTLDKMLAGGIYDQIGGGISRYSTDEKWLVPHFEKMLYDNALFLLVLAEAYQVTKIDNYRIGIANIIQFLERELTNTDGLFYSALDADSEGVEGKYYVWNKSEIDTLLGNDSNLFCQFYQVTEEGNWEGENILHTTQTLEQFATLHQLEVSVLRKQFEQSKAILLTTREKRIHPLLDNKVQVSWNALMNSALVACYQATGESTYQELAIRNMNGMLAHFTNGATLSHLLPNPLNKEGFLEDYAFLADALISLYEVTGIENYILKAKELSDYCIQNFSIADSPFLSFTAIHQTDVILSKQEIYDGASPSANSIFNKVLLKLAICFENKTYEVLAKKQLQAILPALIQHPTSFSNWALNAANEYMGWSEITLVNCLESPIVNSFQQYYWPGKMVLHANSSTKSFLPILQSAVFGKSGIQLCKKETCQPIAETLEKLEEMYRANFKTLPTN